jgi:hypothetical protein
MSSIIYYSNFCEHSKRLLQGLAKSQVSKDIHFICIDNRIKENGKLFIQLPNGQKIIMPENVTKVPALLLINQNYKILYGEEINNYFRPRQETITKQVTHNNLEPFAYSFGGSGFSGIVSDQYSFLDMDADSLTAKGNGGARQMHNYVTMDYMDTITDTTDNGSAKNSGRMTESEIERFQKEREKDMNTMKGRPPI